MNDFKEHLLEYLKNEREISKNEIDRHKSMSPKEKEVEGLMIRDARISITDDENGSDEYRLRFENNYTKIRLGDKILLTPEGRSQIKTPFTVLEVAPKYMIIKANGTAFDESGLWDIDLH